MNARDYPRPKRSGPAIRAKHACHCYPFCFPLIGVLCRVTRTFRTEPQSTHITFQMPWFIIAFGCANGVILNHLWSRSVDSSRRDVWPVAEVGPQTPMPRRHATSWAALTTAYH